MTTVAYVMSRFPKLTETFILYEILAMEDAGAKVELFPLLRERERVMHAEAAAYVERAHYLPFVSLDIVATNARLLRTRPRTYLATAWAVAKGTWGSPNFMVGALGIFLKVAHASVRMKELGVDHVHCHFATHPALAGLIVSRLAGIPFSFTAHGSDLHVDRHMLPQKVDDASFAVAVSSLNRDIILDECRGRHHDKVHVIHCGVDTDVFAPAATTAAEPTAAFEVLCVGTLHEVKGQRHLIDAIGELAPHGVDVRCTFVGDGPDRGVLEARAVELGVTDRCTFSGQRSREQVAEMVKQAAVLCAPSVPTRGRKREGIPIVLMEAMAAGRAVVASDLSGIPELVDHETTGLLTPPGDASAIAAALQRLHDDPDLRERLGRAAREKVIADFDVRSNARDLLATIEAAVVG